MTIPIREALGRKIRCPDNHCGHPALVQHARDRVSRAAQSAPIRTAAQWYLVECGRSGAKLYKANTMVEVVE